MHAKTDDTGCAATGYQKGTLAASLPDEAAGPDVAMRPGESDPSSKSAAAGC